MKILIGADLVPTQSNEALFKAGDVMALVGEDLLSVLKDADYRIFNLEVPLTDIAVPVYKCGPALIAATDTVSGYTALGVDLLTLANNHIMDQGEQGLQSTIKVLEDNEIAYVGAGKDLQEALKPVIIERDGRRIGVYACAEHEFSIAGENLPGANPFDPLESTDHVAVLKNQCDYVIVLYHGGKEHYRYPSPNLQKVCRKLVEKGADLVVCQHSHCVGSEEKYLSGTIVYGQGNFLFDHDESEYWQTSLLIRLEEDFTVTYIPLVKTKQTVRLAERQVAQKILEEFKDRSLAMRDPKKLEKNYADFAKKMHTWYLTAFSGISSRNICYRALNKLSRGRWGMWYLKRKYPKKMRLALQNFVECEAHHELFLAGLKVK